MNMNQPRVVGSAKKKIYTILEDKARYMRANPTPAELSLWEQLSNKKLGVKFRRQHIIDQFIVDFYCIEKSLVIEVDGDVHDSQQIRDEYRDKFLEALGCTVIRFRNEEVLNNLQNVIQQIRVQCV